MGIRFRCHHCETELHVKDFQAGKRGRCPACQGRFRIPPTDAPHSLAPDASLDEKPDSFDTAGGETSQPTIAADAEPSSTCGPAEQQSASQITSQVPEPAAPPQATISQPKLPQALQSAVESKWYIRPKSGGQFGPASSQLVWQWLGENRVGRDALVWCEGWPEWLIAAEVFDDYFRSVEQDSLPPDIPDGSALGNTASSLTAVDVALGSPSLSKQVPSSDAAAASERTVNATATSSRSWSDRHRIGRNLKKRRNYTVMIAALTVIMLLLIGALIIVLLRQTA